MAKRKFHVVIGKNIKPRPKDHEISAAKILANHFKCDVYFIGRTINHTPDILIGNIRWEIKSPTGDGSRNIENTLRTAKNQSENIVIDLSHSKLPITRARGYIKDYLKKPNRIKRLLVITKGKTIEKIK